MRNSVFATLLVCFSMAPAAVAAEANWTPDVHKALSKARESRRPLLLLFTSEHCVYCTKLKQFTLRDRSITQQIQKEFVPAEMDGQQHRQLATRLGVQAYPSMVIISPDNRYVGKIDGYLDPTSLAARLRAAQRQVQQLARSPRSPETPAPTTQ